MARSAINLTIAETNGPVVPFATLEVLRESDGVRPQLHTAREGGATVGNPFTSTEEGYVGVYAAPGRYRFIARNPAGDIVREWGDVLLVDDAVTVPSEVGRAVLVAASQQIARNEIGVVKTISPADTNAGRVLLVGAGPNQLGVSTDVRAMLKAGDFDEVRDLLEVEVVRQNNLTATTNPTITDDNAAGYSVLSKWVNTVSGEIFLCVNDSTGAADWQQNTLTLGDLSNLAVTTGSTVGIDLVTAANAAAGRAVLDLGGAATEDRERWPLSLPDITSLASLNPALLVDGQQFSRKEFWPGTGVGGVSLYWKADEPVANHNGGTIIDPARISELNPATKAFNDYFDADTVSGDLGCFVAVDGLSNCVAWFGAIGDGALDNHLPLQAALDGVGALGGRVYIPVGRYYVSQGLSTTRPSLLLEAEAGAGYQLQAATEIVTDQPITILTSGSFAATEPRGIQIKNIGFRDTSGVGAVVNAINIIRQNHCRFNEVSFNQLLGGSCVNFDGGTDACILPVLTNCVARECKFVVTRTPGTQFVGPIVKGGYFATATANPIAGSIAILANTSARVETAIDNYETAVHCTGEQAHVASRFEKTGTAIRIDKNAGRTLVTGSTFAANTVDVEIEDPSDGTSGIRGANTVAFNAYTPASGVANRLVDHTTGVFTSVLFEPVYGVMACKTGPAAGPIYNRLQHRRQALGDNVAWSAEAAAGGIRAILQARLEATEEIRVGGESNHSTSIVANNVEQARVLRPSSVGTDSTALMLKVNRGGTVTLSAVSIGAADSGGTGFRVLRVPN